MSSAGVPIVDPADQPTNQPALTQDSSAASVAQPAQQQWGFFDDNGNAVIVADNIASVDFKSPSDISDYVVEQGAFASYDKVQRPFDGVVRFTTGQTIAARAAFLQSCDAAKNSLNLYTLVQPEVTYPSVNIIDYTYRRANGIFGLLVVDVMYKQVRQTGTITYSTTPGAPPVTNAADPGSNDPQSGGTVQTTSPSPSQQSTLDGTYNSTETIVPAGH